MGQSVNIYFPIIDRTHCFSGKVVWVDQFAKGFDTGIEFENADELYSLRMVEQVCHIEHYRNQVKEHEGRTLSIEDAAEEWIKRFAGEFPGIEK